MTPAPRNQTVRAAPTQPVDEMPQSLADIRIAAAEDLQHPGDADIVLLPGRAALLSASQTLVCADVHLGKAATFRRAGLPVPEGSAQQDLKRLAGLITAYDAHRLIIAGDLFHARAGCTPRVLGEFTDFREQIRQRNNTEVVLVLGNHERSLGRQFSPRDLGIDQSVQELVEPPFRFVHEPATTFGSCDLGRSLSVKSHQLPPTAATDSFAAAATFTIAGHLHPTISLRSPSGDRLSGRCFVATPGLLVLPAFGSFTGGHRVMPEHDMQIWLAQDDGAWQATELLQS